MNRPRICTDVTDEHGRNRPRICTDVTDERGRNRPRICTDVTDEHGLKIKISVAIRIIRGNPWFIPKAHTEWNDIRGHPFNPRQSVVA